MTIEALRKGAAPAPLAATVDLAALAPGGTASPAPADAAVADGVRLTLRGSPEAGVLFSEVQVAASPIAAGAEPRLTVSYPAHGECVDHRAYLRGFVSGLAGAGGGRPASLRVNGEAVADGVAADGAFGVLIGEGMVARKRGGPGARISTSPPRRARSCTRRSHACTDGPPALAGGRPAEVSDDGAPFGQAAAWQPAKITYAGVTLDIPAGALEHDARITVRPLAGADVAPMDALMDNVTPERRGYRFGPHGLRFKKPVRLTLPYARPLLPPGTTEADVLTFFYDEDAQRWRPIGRMAAARGARSPAAAITSPTPPTPRWPCPITPWRRPSTRTRSRTSSWPIRRPGF